MIFTFFDRAKKVAKKARPVTRSAAESHEVQSRIPRSLLIFRESQNPRNFVPFRHTAIHFPKNPCARGAFQRGLLRTVHTPGNEILFSGQICLIVLIKDQTSETGRANPESLYGII